MPRGEKNRKLTDEQVLAIRRDARAYRVIAEDYGVSKSLVAKIALGKTRRALPWERGTHPQKRHVFGDFTFIADMQVGDSRTVPDRSADSASAVIVYWRRKTGFHLKSRTTTFGVRITRTA